MKNEVKSKKKLICLIVIIILLTSILTVEFISYGILRKNTGKWFEEDGSIVEEDKNDVYYKVFFDEDNGSDIKSVKVKENSKLELYKPSKIGYRFVRWELNNSIVITNDYIVKKDVLLKAIWEKQEEETVHLLSNILGRIVINVDQINIRERASVGSADIGDVYYKEEYEVYNFVEDYNYVWYKIKKDNIEGWVASKKENNWLSYYENIDNIIVNELNVDEKIVGELLLPVISGEYNCWVGPNTSFLKESLSNTELIYWAFNYKETIYWNLNEYNKKEYYENLKRNDIKQYFASFEELNNYYQTIFGKESSLTPENIKQSRYCDAKVCINCTKDVNYNVEDGGYWLFEGGCGVTCANSRLLYTDVISADKIEDELVIEYNIYWLYYFDMNNELKLYGINDSNNEPLATFSCANTCSREERIKFRNKNRDKLPVYKAIFKKQSDGKYYYYSGVWE